MQGGAPGIRTDVFSVAAPVASGGEASREPDPTAKTQFPAAEDHQDGREGGGGRHLSAGRRVESVYSVSLFRSSYRPTTVMIESSSNLKPAVRRQALTQREADKEARLAMAPMRWRCSGRRVS